MKRVYIVGPTEVSEDYHEAAYALNQQGFIAHWQHVTLDDNVGLRKAIAALTECDAICLLDAWWTSREANCLQTIAAWLRMEVLSPKGEKLPTSSLRG